jgi:hypothetical protein
LKVHPHDLDGARRALRGLVTHLDDACIGSIDEVFDARPPFTPRECIAQAWNVTPPLRAWVKLPVLEQNGAGGNALDAYADLGDLRAGEETIQTMIYERYRISDRVEGRSVQ